MKETLEFSLREYKGAVVTVSHDRWFLSQVCNRIVEIKDGKVITYQGDYRYYMNSNDDVATKVQNHYIKGASAITTVPDTEAVRKVKERGGLKKYAGVRRRAEKMKAKEQLYSVDANATATSQTAASSDHKKLAQRLTMRMKEREGSIARAW